MKKRKTPIALILGILLVTASLCLVIITQAKEHMGYKKIQATLEFMESVLPERYAGVPNTYPVNDMPVLEIGGEDYSALLEIPSINIALPIADNWNGSKLYNSPARFFGSAYNSSLVIGGTSGSHQFEFCKKIETGTVVTVTDMMGAQFVYEVVRVDRATDPKAKWLTGTEHDLTLFCRDSTSMEYIAVRCDSVYNLNNVSDKHVVLR